MRRLIAILVPILAVGGIMIGRCAAQTPSKQEDAAKLVAVLKSDAPQYDKAQACRQLAIIGGKDAIPVLAGLLGDEKLSHMARYGLEPMSDPAVDDALRDAAGKLKGRLQVGVINSIGVRKDAKAVELLGKLLGDADPEVAAAAATALGKIGGEAAGKLLAAAASSAAGPVKNAVYDAQVRVADGMVAAGQKQAAQAIYDRVRASDAVRPIRMAAMRGAVLARGDAGVPLLIEQVRGNDEGMFSIALRLAAEIPGAPLTNALAAEVEKAPAAKKILLIQALGGRHDAAGLPAIAAAARAGDKPVRIVAIQVIPQVAAANAVPMLFELAADADGEIANAARQSLAGLSGKEVDDAVVAMLGKPEVATRRIAIGVLGQRRAASAAILKATQDPDAEIRVTAIRALEDVLELDQTSTLVDMLSKTASPQEREALERVLSAATVRLIAGDAYTQKLVDGMAQLKGEPKQAMLRVLRAVGGPKALEAVKAAQKDADPAVQDAATRALCAWTSVDAAEDILAVAKSAQNPTHKILAQQGYIRLSRSRDLQPPQRLEMLKTATGLAERDQERRAIIGALGELGNPPALAMVADFASTASVKNEAAVTALAISEKMVGRNPGPVVAAMKKIIAGQPEKDLATRAQEMLNRAEKTKPQ